MNSANELVRVLVEVHYLQKHAFPEQRKKILEMIVINLDDNLECTRTKLTKSGTLA